MWMQVVPQRDRRSLIENDSHGCEELTKLLSNYVALQM